jgi:putative oxidoreductase
MPPKVKSFFQPLNLPKIQSAALLFVRLVVGIAFLHHGWGKIQTPMSWMPPEAGIPGFLQLLAAISEFGGGLALILGLLTSLAMVGMAFTMIVATHMHAIVRQDPFVSMDGGPSFELALLYLSLALMFLAVGPGQFSADAKIFGLKKS